MISRATCAGRRATLLLGGTAALLALAGCTPDRVAAPAAGGVARDVTPGAGSALVVDVSGDTTAQNETPLAVNPTNPDNFLVGANDWNYNNGCAVSASLDGGKTWTRTLPNGFLPGVTRYTNDPAVPGTGAYDSGGDPAVGFGPNGTAYFACFGYQAGPPYHVALLFSRSTDGGRTWLAGGPAQPLVQASVSPAQRVTSGSVRSDQDQRIVTDPRTGTAYLTFDNSIQGGKGTALYVSVSTNRGASWSAPVRFGTFQNPVCLFPPDCFNISGAPFRGPGSYPVPAVDPTRNRLYVAYTDIVGGLAQVFVTYASLGDLTHWSTPQVVAPGAGDRINVEMSIEPASGRLDLMTNDRSWSGNTLFDVTYLGSRDGGATWTTRRVTPASWDPSQYGVPDASSPTGVRPFIGDYDGIVSLPNAVGMAWTGPGPTTGALPTNLEIYFGRLTP